MKKEIIKLVMAGSIQREERSNLANPWLKLALVIIPLTAGTYQLSMRLLKIPFTNQAAVAFITILLGVLAAQSIDLRRKNFGRMLRWTISCISFEVIVFLLAAGIIHVEAIRKGIPSFAPIGFVGGYVTLGDAILFACFLVSARGVRLLNATDAFTLCGVIPWAPRLQALYETCIVTYFTIAHSISGLFSQAALVAENRYRLMRAQSRRLAAFLSASNLYIKAILAGFTERAELTESILEERQWYSGLASDPFAAWNAEDSVAVIVVILFCGIAWLGWVVGRV